MRVVKPGFWIGFAGGYVLGARAGRERYEQMRRWWHQLTGSPQVQRAVTRTRTLASDRARRSFSTMQQGVERAGSAVRNRLHRGDVEPMAAPLEDSYVDLVEEDRLEGPTPIPPAG